MILDSLNSPLLRWAGGKWRLLKLLIKYLPKDISSRYYIEPFIGAGSLFFYLKPISAFISDANSHLINFYKQIRDFPEEVFNLLYEHAKNNGKEYYYQIREEYNLSGFTIEQAARFIYLNRTCFNGIFRVNKKGFFNVPYGKKEPPALPTKQNLYLASKILEKSKIEALDYKLALKEARKNNFIYLDPPYPPLNGTSFFTHYTSDRFCENDQITLASMVDEIDRKGALFLLSNADTHLIRNLYKKYNVYELSVVRWITSKSVKHKVSELVITNYDIGKRN